MPVGSASVAPPVVACTKERRGTVSGRRASTLRRDTIGSTAGVGVDGVRLTRGEQPPSRGGSEWKGVGVTELGRSAARHSLAVPGRPGTRVALAWGAATDVGHKRRLNEDSYLAESPVFAVADGMGGHSSGDVASAAVVRRLEASTASDFIDPAQVLVALREATEDISLAEDASDRGVGTTVTGVALTLQGGAPYWAVFNVGDSRVYRFENDELDQITVDHSVVQELVSAGLLRPEDAEFHPDSNVITRAIGFNETPMPDYWLLPVEVGTRLIVCSDGLTKEIDDARIAEILGEGAPARQAAVALVEAALESGGRDNVTVVIVDVLAVEPA